MVAHPLHPHAPFATIHLQTLMDGLGYAFNVIRVHHQRIQQLGGRARELAQHQHTILVIACGNILLGYQIHPIVQRGNQAHIRRAIPLIHLLMAALPLDQQDGPPQGRLEAPVDALHGLHHLTAQILIAGNPRAARRGNLHHGQPLEVPGMLFEKLLDCHQPLHDALGIVHAVYAHNQGFTAQTELLEQLRARGPWRSPLRLCAVQGHTHRIGAHGAGVPIPASGHVFAVGP